MEAREIQRAGRKKGETRSANGGQSIVFSCSITPLNIDQRRNNVLPADSRNCRRPLPPSPPRNLRPGIVYFRRGSRPADLHFHFKSKPALQISRARRPTHPATFSNRDQNENGSRETVGEQSFSSSSSSPFSFERSSTYFE